MANRSTSGSSAINDGKRERLLSGVWNPAVLGAEELQ